MLHNPTTNCGEVEATPVPVVLKFSERFGHVASGTPDKRPKTNPTRGLQSSIFTLILAREIWSFNQFSTCTGPENVIQPGHPLCVPTARM